MIKEPSKYDFAPAPSPGDLTPRLRVADRCDRCGAQAFVRIDVPLPPPDFDPMAPAGSVDPSPSADLYLCGHHYRECELTVIAAGYRVYDERYRINEKPTPGADNDLPA